MKKGKGLMYRPDSTGLDADVRAADRWQFLQHCLKLKPEIKTELAEAGNDPTKLKSWAQRWHLEDDPADSIRRGFRLGTRPGEPELIDPSCDPSCARLLRQGGFRRFAAPEDVDAAMARFLDTSALIEAGVDIPIPDPLPEFEDHPDDINHDTYLFGLFLPREFRPPRFFYSPEVERPAEFKARVLKATSTSIDDFCTQTRDDALRKGWKGKPDRRYRDTLDTEFDKHLKWLAQRQILGRRSATIANRELYKGFEITGSIDRDRIQKTVEGFAKYLGLKLRRV